MRLSHLTAAAALAMGAAALSTPASAQSVGVYIGPSGGYYGDYYGPRTVYRSPGYYAPRYRYYRYGHGRSARRVFAVPNCSDVGPRNLANCVIAQSQRSPMRD